MMRMTGIIHWSSCLSVSFSLWADLTRQVRLTLVMVVSLLIEEESKVQSTEVCHLHVFMRRLVQVRQKPMCRVHLVSTHSPVVSRGQIASISLHRRSISGQYQVNIRSISGQYKVSIHLHISKRRSCEFHLNEAFVMNVIHQQSIHNLNFTQSYIFMRKSCLK